MNLVVYWTDLRGGYTSKVTFRTDVVDQDTGKKVGFVEATSYSAKGGQHCRPFFETPI